MDLGLTNARVLVTAASAGLGAATARKFSQEGAIVVISSRNLEKLQQTAAAIVEETGNPVFTFRADVSQPEEIERLVRNSAEVLGGLDVLVTNAGGPPSGRFDDFSLEQWQEATQLTLFSAMNLVRAALPHLRQSARAAVLTVTSISAREPIDNLILSNTLRPAVIGLTKSLANELGETGIRVNSILPGVTDTERIGYLMNQRAADNQTTAEEEKVKSAAAIPLKRIGRPEEFANAAVFLCSPAASFINGVALPVDGGALRGAL